MKQLKFEEDHVAPILLGDKWKTIRQMGKFNGVDEGDLMELITSDGTHFGVARLVSVEKMTAGEIVGYTFSGHKTYHTRDEFVEEMNEYWPEMQICSITEFEVASFTVIS